MKTLLLFAFIFGNAPWCTVDQAGTAICGYASYDQCMQSCVMSRYCVGCVINPNE